MTAAQIVAITALSAVGAVGAAALGTGTYSKVNYGVFDPFLARKIVEYFHLEHAVDEVESMHKSVRPHVAEGLWNQLVDGKILVGKDLEKKKIEFFKQCGINDQSNLSGTVSCDIKTFRKMQCEAKYVGWGLPDSCRAAEAEKKWKRLIENGTINDEDARDFNELKIYFFKMCDVPDREIEIFQEMKRKAEFVKQQHSENSRATLATYTENQHSGNSLTVLANTEWKAMINDGIIYKHDYYCYDRKIKFFKMCGVSDKAIEIFQQIQRMAKFVKKWPQFRHELMADFLWKNLMSVELMSKHSYVIMKTDFYELCDLPVPEITENSYNDDVANNVHIHEIHNLFYRGLGSEGDGNQESRPHLRGFYPVINFDTLP